MTLIIAGTGHRPKKLAPPGICYTEHVLERLTALCKAYLNRIYVTEVISGMALGFDTALCIAALDLGIQTHAAIPFEGQESTWKLSDRERYNYLLSRCTKQVIVCEGGYHPRKLYRRNEYMIDNCTRVLALYDGIKDGGTSACITYAKRKQVPIDNVWKSWIKYNGI